MKDIRTIEDRLVQVSHLLESMHKQVQPLIGKVDRETYYSLSDTLRNTEDKVRAILTSMFRPEPTPINSEAVDTTIQALIARLPEGYPLAELQKHEEGYMLTIGNTTVFRAATSHDAIRHTAHYVKAREEHPTLPVGVIYGMYD